jgi:hypothetical protein
MTSATNTLVFDLNKKYIGTLVGCYHPDFYSKYLFKNNYELWNKNYPNWKNNLLFIVLYDEPQYNLSKKELSQFFDIPEEVISDKLHQELAIKMHYMVVPGEAVVLSTDENFFTWVNTDENKDINTEK